MKAHRRNCAVTLSMFGILFCSVQGVQAALTSTVAVCDSCCIKTTTAGKHVTIPHTDKHQLNNIPTTIKDTTGPGRIVINSRSFSPELKKRLHRKLQTDSAKKFQKTALAEKNKAAG